MTSVRENRSSVSPCAPNRFVAAFAVLLALAVFLAAVPQSARAASQTHGRESVLVLHSYSPDFVWTRSQQDGVDAVFGPLAATYDVRIEYLDALHHPGLLKDPLLLDFFRAKFKTQQFRVVLTSDNAAFDFARAHRAELFPEAPIVFMGLNGFKDSTLQGESGITGVAEDSDMAGTLQTLLKLAPQTKRIVFPGMADDITYRAIRTTITKDLATLPPQIVAEFPEYPNVDAAIEALRTLPPDSAIVIMSNMRTRDGEGISSQHVVELVSAAVSVPVFTNWDFVVGHGAVGGSVISGLEQGRLAGEIAVRVLDGERPESIPVRRGAGKTLLFDHRQLERFGIPTSRLPPGAEVLFAPERFFRISREAAWIAGVSFALLLGVIAALFRAVQRRRRAEEQVRTLNQGLEQRVQERTAELSVAMEAAETANRAKSTFLANMSHELRTPLNAILGFAQIMERDARLPEDERKNVATINRSGNHLLSLINDVLEIARIEAGRTQSLRTVFDLPATLMSVEEMIRIRAEAKGLAFDVERPADLQPRVLGDGHHLSQVLINLLGNAVKYTDQGRIALRVEPEDNDRIRFEISDTGLGIAKDDQERVFQAFYQTERGIAKSEGTGLGLTISRQFVRLMGGEIMVASELGKGSTFSFSIPLPPTDAAPHAEEGARIVGLADGQTAPRILVAEDHPDNQQVVEQLLRQIGFQVKIAANGQAAIDCFQTWHPQLILMDMRMPVMDGYQATQAIRQLPGGESIPIVALTASAFEEDRGKVLAAGCNDMVRKPIEQNPLFEIIGRMLGLRFDYAEAARTEHSGLATEATDLSSLPADMRMELRQAAGVLDKEAITAIVDRLRSDHHAEAETIANLVESYHFDVIEKLCQ
jgi:signal transduction histidine kinase/DNA-binding response OmpR family regulator